MYTGSGKASVYYKVNMTLNVHGNGTNSSYSSAVWETSASETGTVVTAIAVDPTTNNLYAIAGYASSTGIKGQVYVVAFITHANEV